MPSAAAEQWLDASAHAGHVEARPCAQVVDRGRVVRAKVCVMRYSRGATARIPGRPAHTGFGTLEVWDYGMPRWSIAAV